MNSNAGFTKGQKVTTPGGEGEVIEIIGRDVKVKLTDGGEEIFPQEDVQDDSDAG